MTWKEAVKRVGLAAIDRRAAVAEGLVSKLSTQDCEKAVVQALLREAHGVQRRDTRAAEMQAVRPRSMYRPVVPKDVEVHLIRAIGPVIQTHREGMDLIYTEEFLAQTFTLRDGTVISWGEATVAQHKERSTMFQQLAVANLDGATKHNKAIQDIEAAGVGCLRELLERAA